MYDVIASAMYREKVRPRSGRETGLGHVQVPREDRRRWEREAFERLAWAMSEVASAAIS